LERAATATVAPTVITGDNFAKTVITAKASSVTDDLNVENLATVITVDESRELIVPSVITPEPSVITVITPKQSVMMEDDLEEVVESRELIVPSVITPEPSVITVITPEPSVITVITPKPSVMMEDDLEEVVESRAIDFLNTPLHLRTIAKALREMRGLILTELNNLAKGNGKRESVEARLEQRKGEFLKLYEGHESELEVHYWGLVEQKNKLFQH
jgi:hypothetical protein